VAVRPASSRSKASTSSWVSRFKSRTWCSVRAVPEVVTTLCTPVCQALIASKYPSIRTACRASAIALRARCRLNSVRPLSYSAVWGLFKYFGCCRSSITRPPNPTSSPRSS
jgi:hypothetical protein